MSQLPHIFYPSPGDEEFYCLGCRKFASSKSAQEKWEKMMRHLEMTNRGREFIGGEFARLLQDWYRPTEGLAPAEVQVYGGDACLVIRKVLGEFALMQAKYKLLTNHSPLLWNDKSSKPVPGYNPGHNLETGYQEPHNDAILILNIYVVSPFILRNDTIQRVVYGTKVLHELSAYEDVEIFLRKQNCRRGDCKRSKLQGQHTVHFLRNSEKWSRITILFTIVYIGRYFQLFNQSGGHYIDWSAAVNYGLDLDFVD
ncbi:hypothetical protein DSO57_1018899 [Entomophthora muscae]|uniref:Uncharacterized protein n=1 Tax=Entomophthora muscae TaxID=34485 RepID=A0ACC2TRB3_9FUNG|nr:hypothetical protein DSO57_1018899 [Entomophthora muscae]